MSGVLSVVGAIGTVALLWLFWFVVVVVIPGIFAVYVSMLFPLTGQWRKRSTERLARRKK